MLIVKHADYEEITPKIVDKIKKDFRSSGEYVDSVLAKKSSKAWAESTAGIIALDRAMTACAEKTKHLVIKRMESGKPYFENSPLFFNISHSCGRAVCALSDKEVGIDIEFTKKARNFDLIATNFFSPEELEIYHGAKGKAEEFYRIWTRKEALLKKVGTGIEHNILKNINTYAYDEVEFVEIKRGGYIMTICKDKDDED